MKNIIYIYILFILFLGGCINNKKPKDNGGNITGIGATFPLPFYNIVFENYYQKTGNRIFENSKNSGTGMRTLQDKTVDFASSEAIPSKEEFAEFKDTILMVPSCLGGVVISFNIPEVKKIKLTGTVIADIFMNKINYWNDDQIQSLNPEVNLPEKEIIIIYRSDGSGTSYVLSDYLCKVSPEWNIERGRGKALKWDKGIGVEGCLKVASLISELNYSIGYTGAEHADIFNLATAAIKNQHGEFVKANSESILAAADIDPGENLPVMITNSPNKNSYPLSCFSWIMVYKNQAYANRSFEKYESLKSFLKYIISPNTQKVASNLNYAPLPDHITKKAEETVNSLKWEK